MLINMKLYFLKKIHLDLELNWIHVDGIFPLINLVVLTVKLVDKVWQCRKGVGWVGRSFGRLWRENAQCDYSCTEAGRLETHMRIHSGENPSSCTQCNSCKHARNLRRHMITQSGGRCFSYTQCAYSCTTAAHLNRHMMMLVMMVLINTLQLLCLKYQLSYHATYYRIPSWSKEHY